MKTFLAWLLALTPIALLAQSQPIKWDVMDLGPFHTGTFKVSDQIVAKGIAIKAGPGEDGATLLFDPELMRVAAAWTGGFLKFPRARGGLEGQIAPGGEVKFSTAYAPGWAAGEIGADPRDKHQGHLPHAVAKWQGLHLSGDKVVLSYSIGQSRVLETPGFARRGGATVFTRAFRIGATKGPLNVLIADVPGGVGAAKGNVARLATGDRVTAVAVTGAPNGSGLAVGANGRLTLMLPPIATAALFEVAIAVGSAAELPETSEIIKPGGVREDPALLLTGGPARWGAPLETKGKLGDGDQAYLADEITLPEDNPFKSWLRPGGHDFLPDGTAVLANLSGDVWLVSGLDEKLESVRWKRFATGLFQPLGCKVVDGKIYILGRDQITRLHDLNGDGEADFYENFNNDCVVTDNYHEFALDLQTDSRGDFFYAKGSPWQPTNTSPHQGCMIKVSKDGSKFEVVATGLRAPNGLGMSPRDELSVSDNQGHWMPANRLSFVKPGGFYGMVPAAHRVLTFKAADGREFKADPSDAAARAEHKTDFWGRADVPIPAEHDLPLCWVPMQIDNSSGGQVWVPPGGKWGPLSGRMLFLSYGKCALFNVLHETVDGQAQGGLCRLPLKFNSGIMRARFSPRDGQLYVSGLNVWQSSAAKDGCFYRVRYTGKPATIPVDLRAVKGGVQIGFTAPLDAASATDPQNFSVEQWNYAWTGHYGSDDISVADPTKRKTRDLVLINAIELSPDKKTLTLEIPNLQPVMQMKVKYRINAADGSLLDQEIHNTIHRVPQG